MRISDSQIQLVNGRIKALLAAMQVVAAVIGRQRIFPEKRTQSFTLRPDRD